MPYVGIRRYIGPPHFAAVAAMDPLVGMKLDARQTDICLDCCEEARAQPLDCGGWRYVELLGECLSCGCLLSRCAIVLPGFVGPTRRGDAPFQPERVTQRPRPKAPYPVPYDPASVAAYDAYVRGLPPAPPPPWAHGLGPPGRGNYLGYRNGKHHWKGKPDEGTECSKKRVPPGEARGD